METSLKFSWDLLKYPLIWAAVILVVVLDQISKQLIILFLPIYRRIEFIPYLNIVHAKNRGAAFSLFHDSSPAFRFFFFGVVTILCLGLLIYWIGTTPLQQKWQRFSFALILGGAFGNLIDRVLYGEVTDFIDVFYKSYHWPAFNVADSSITVGVSIIVLTMIGPTAANFLKKWKKTSR